MAQYPYRANIQSSTFPLLSELMGRTVIIPGRDQTFAYGLNPSDSVSPVDREVPQILYGHNIMPGVYGYQSVGYTPKYPAAPGSNNIDAAYLMVSTEGIRTYISVDYLVGQRLLALQQSGVWAVIGGDAIPAIGPANRVSVATINGITYLCIAHIGTYKYTVGTNSFTKVTLAGLNDGTVNGVVASSGYLLTWSDTGIAWSASDDPLDFVPSSVTGAGAASIQDAQGKLIHCEPTSYGFIIYTENNAISVTWSGNATYPFNTKAIPGSGGVASSDLVCKETTGMQYAYTTNGLQQVYHTGAKTILPYVTDFVAGQVFEDFDETTNILNVTSITNTMRKKLTLVSDRYLVLSYGIFTGQPMTHALVVDLPLSRMGKLRFTHNAVFDLRNIAPEVIETPRQSIALINSDGTVSTTDFSLRSTTSSGVLILGRYQYVRNQLLTLQRLQFENIQPGADFEALDAISMDGKDLQPAQDLFLDPPGPGDKVRNYYATLTGQNHCIIVKGNFNLMTLLFDFTLGGRY